MGFLVRFSGIFEVRHGKYCSSDVVCDHVVSLPNTGSGASRMWLLDLRREEFHNIATCSGRGQLLVDVFGMGARDKGTRNGNNKESK